MFLQNVDRTYHLFVLQLIMPVIAVWATLTYFTWPWFIAALVMFFLMRCVGAVVTYHRIHGHRTHTMHPVVEFICTGLGFYGSISSPIDFCSTHVNHHKYMDTEKDPHSPKYLGWKAMFPLFWVDRQTGDLRTMVRLGKNKITRFYHDYYWPLLLVPFLLLFVSLEAFLFLFVVPTGLSLFTLSISTLNHDENGPKKMPWWYGVLTGGEHHHKWHHEHATDTSGEGWLDYVANAVGTRRVKK